MKTTTLSCRFAVFALLCATAPAQDARPPAAQLDKLDVMLGTWEVSGTAKETPDGEDLPWTAVQTVRRVLGGHFVRDEMIIETGGPQIAFLSFTGWDHENQRYASYGAGNMGMVTTGELLIVDSNTVVSAMAGVIQGQLITERSVVRLDGDRYTFDVQQAVGDGPFFTAVQGTGRRTSAEGKAQAVEAALSFAPPAPEMALFEKMVGEYEVVGSMTPMPGAPEMSITGTETISMTLGGVVMQHHVTGEAEGFPEPYEAYGFSAWNPRDKCYDTISVNNMGMGAKSQLRKLDDHTLVDTMAAQVNGQPTLTRTIMKLDGEGAISSVAADAFYGAAEALRAFSATYSKKR